MARSSENPPVFARAVIEKEADEFLLGTRGPSSDGRVYELGDGVESPKSKEEKTRIVLFFTMSFLHAQANQN